MDKNKIFERNVPGTHEILRNATVGISGCGGLGSNAAVALTRAGIGKLIIADHDVVEESNLNRQHFYQSDIGKKKVEALAYYLKSINPEIGIVLIDRQIIASDIPRIFKDADILIEAFDRAEAKAWLIESWCTAFPKRPIVCASGLSGVGRTEDLKIQNTGTIYIVGDGETDMSMGLCSARVAVVANMQANIAIELLVNNKGKANDPC
jgi:sulfur carrier protein ThiS adenylyltransferase